MITEEGYGIAGNYSRLMMFKTWIDNIDYYLKSSLILFIVISIGLFFLFCELDQQYRVCHCHRIQHQQDCSVSA